MFEVLATRERRRLRRGTRAFTREVDDGHARIFVDHGFQWDGSTNVWLTRARASFVLRGGPEFDIRPRGLLSRFLGYQPGVSSGDPCFDDFFVVRTSDPVSTWSALTTRVRSLLAGAFEDARLVSDGRTVVLWREGDFGREMDAEAAVELVSEVVHYGAEAIEQLRHLPGGLYYPARGPWDERQPPRAILHTPTPVVVEPSCAGIRGAVLGASAPCGRASAPFRIAIDADGRVHGRAGRPPPRGAEHAVPPAIGPCSVSCDGHRVELRWRSLRVGREAILAGARLIGAFAATQQNGLYR